MTIWIVPPYNNGGWPEVALYRELVERAATYESVSAFSPLQREWNTGSFAPEAQMDSISEFVHTWRLCTRHDRLTRDDAMIFVEGLSPLPHIARVLSKQAGFGNGPAMVGLMHGGSGVAGDTLALDVTIERAIVLNYDRIITPTEFLRDVFDDVHGGGVDIPIGVIRWPLPDAIFDTPSKPLHAKQPKIIFPHRKVPEKGWPLFQEVAQQIATNAIDGVYWQPEAIEGFHKIALYNRLATCRAVFASASMETYGVAVEEAITLGCCPVLNHHPVYEDLYRDSGVHWHDGDLASVRDALAEVNICTRHHGDMTREHNHWRSERIFDYATAAAASTARF